LLDRLGADALNRIFEIKVDGESGVAYAAAAVGHLFGVARRHIAREQVAERRVLPLEIVIPLVFGNLFRRARIALLLRHPHAAVVAQALAHQRELGLMVAGYRNTSGMD